MHSIYRHPYFHTHFFSSLLRVASCTDKTSIQWTLSALKLAKKKNNEEYPEQSQVYGVTVMKTPCRTEYSPTTTIIKHINKNAKAKKVR